MLSLLKNHKKILQILPSFAEHDAVSNQVVSMNKVLEANGYKTKIYSNHFPKKYKGVIGEPKFLKERKFDLAIYHHSIGDPVVDIVKHLSIPVLLYYHNITPPDYYAVYNQRIYELLNQGLKQLDDLTGHVEVAIAASEFNSQQLSEFGFDNTKVLPIFFEPKRLNKITADHKTASFLDNNNVTNILFVGRFSPNKVHKDMIKAFYLYRKYYNSMARLNLVGSYVEMNSYLAEITELIEALELESSVHVPGLVTDEEWKAYYENSDVFLSLSEHEGFFVPALEANYFELPIIAYDAGAVASTAGGSAVLLDNKEPAIVAETIHKMVSDQKLRSDLIEKGRNNYVRFDADHLGPKLLEIVKQYV